MKQVAKDEDIDLDFIINSFYKTFERDGPPKILFICGNLS